MKLLAVWDYFNNGENIHSEVATYFSVLLGKELLRTEITYSRETIEDHLMVFAVCTRGWKAATGKPRW